MEPWIKTKEKGTNGRGWDKYPPPQVLEFIKSEFYMPNSPGAYN